MKIRTENKTPKDCGRKEDLIAYLYDEDTAAEHESFALHLRECASCRSEIGVFGRLRDDLSTWQVGLVPRTELSFSKRWLEIGRELMRWFPAWARGVALASAALSVLIFALSVAGPRLGSGRNPSAGALSSAQVQSLIDEAVAKERGAIQEQLQAEYRTQLSHLKTELQAEHEAKLEAVQAGLKAEIKRSNRTRPSIRSFWAMSEPQDLWGEMK
ncbi:MAG TPA: zf-HC2 domain-containing protein [Blastocatellia bacterium]|nr:zf-HC2 domain-containing protein [Blastocatellia bacterium]